MKYSLNLSDNFDPTNLVQILFKKFTFNGGEQHIKLLEPKDIMWGIETSELVVITHRITKASDIMEIVLAKNTLDKIGVRDVALFIPYCPYARQDRVCEIGEPLSIQAFASIINSLSFSKVIIYDAHSSVSTAVLNKCFDMTVEKYIKEAIKLIPSYPIIVFPDYGAQKRYKYLDYTESIVCFKERNTTDGSLSNFQIMGDYDVKDRDCLVVDDICDGGRTFSGVGLMLKNKGARNLYLYTTHGIYSDNAEQRLSPYYKTLFSTNSFLDTPKWDIFKQFKINYNDF